MDPELMKFINSDLTWNTVKKGHRSMTRRPRKPGASRCEFGLGLGNKKQDSAGFDHEKYGVAVLGQHFAEELLEVPIKKRILMLHSPFLNGERAVSPQPETPSPHHEESSQPVGRKHDSGQQGLSNSPSNITKFKNGSSNSELLKPTKKEVSDPSDFSGIELLASAAACDSSDQVDSSAADEHTTPRVDSYTDGIRETIAPMDSDDLSIDNSLPVTQNLCDNDNDGEDERLVPSKDIRLHWDLNTVMDEWEEPCYDILVDPHSQKSYTEGFCNDGLQNAKSNMEGHENETRNSEVTGGEHETMLHSVCTNQSGTNDAAISVTPLIKQEIDGSFGKSYDLVHNIASSREMVGAITFKTSDAESCLSKSDLIDSFVHPVKRENLSTPTSSVSQGQTIVKVESDTMHDLPVYFDPSKKSDNGQPVSEGGCLSLKGDGDDKLISDDRLSDCCGSNVSHEGNTLLGKAKSGYDSPVEDGELRDSTGRTWRKDEVEEMVGVDYELDHIYEDNFDTVESEKNEATLASGHGQTIGDESFLLENQAFLAVPEDVEQCAKEDASDRPNCLLGSKDDSSGVFQPERKNGHAESRTPGGNLCIDRPTSFGVRNNGAHVRRSRFDHVKHFCPHERDFGPGKFTGRDQNDTSGQRVDSSMGAWDSRNSHWYPRPKNVNGSSAARSDRSNSLDDNQAFIYNPRGVHRTFNRRPSPSDRNESYGIHRGTPPARGVSRDRCRGGPGFHLQGSRRAPQEEYHEFEPWYSEQKARGFSPSFNQGAHLSRPHRRSRSRSRSGSPIAWHFQKKRHVDTKNQSPDSRSDPRLQGERIPFRKPSFSGETEVGFVSPHDRNITNGQFRDRRPFQRNKKFETNGYLRRLKSNDHFRPRFPQISGSYREHKFEDEKYGMMDGGRRFKYTVDDSFRTRIPRDEDNGFRYTRNENRRFNDPVGRDIRNASEKRSCRYTIDKMFPTSGDFHKDDFERE